MMTKKAKITILLIFVFVGLLLTVGFFARNRLRIFSASELSLYNGDDPNKPVYIAYEGYVYDVSPGREDFYNPGMSYHYLTGRDSTAELNIAGGGIIKSKYKIVGRYKQ